MDAKTVVTINLSFIFVLVTSFEIIRVASQYPILDCECKFTNYCGDAISFDVFYGARTMSGVCCAQLLNAGRKCHDLLTNVVLSRTEFEGNMLDVRDRHSEVWKLCNNINGQIA